jgi:hypothetical protein
MTKTLEASQRTLIEELLVSARKSVSETDNAVYWALSFALGAVQGNRTEAQLKDLAEMVYLAKEYS